MKRLTTILIAFLALSALRAQDFVAEITAFVKDSRVECDYTYKTSGATALSGYGSAILQGSCYKLEGNGLKIISNGVTRWTVDPSGKEVYIETVGEGDSLLHGLESMLREIPDLKYENGVLSGTVRFPGEEGTVFCTLQNITKSVSGDNGIFTFNTSGLDSSWVITDLR